MQKGPPKRAFDVDFIPALLGAETQATDLVIF